MHGASSSKVNQLSLLDKLHELSPSAHKPRCVVNTFLKVDLAKKSFNPLPPFAPVGTDVYSSKHMWAHNEHMRYRTFFMVYDDVLVTEATSSSGVSLICSSARRGLLSLCFSAFFIVTNFDFRS